VAAESINCRLFSYFYLRMNPLPDVVHYIVEQCLPTDTEAVFQLRQVNRVFEQEVRRAVGRLLRRRLEAMERAVSTWYAANAYYFDAEYQRPGSLRMNWFDAKIEPLEYPPLELCGPLPVVLAYNGTRAPLYWQQRGAGEGAWFRPLLTWAISFVLFEQQQSPFDLDAAAERDHRGAPAVSSSYDGVLAMLRPDLALRTVPSPAAAPGWYFRWQQHARERHAAALFVGYLHVDSPHVLSWNPRIIRRIADGVYRMMGSTQAGVAFILFVLQHVDVGCTDTDSDARVLCNWIYDHIAGVLTDNVINGVFFRDWILQQGSPASPILVRRP
jgi:hypothetical protein